MHSDTESTGYSLNRQNCIVTMSQDYFSQDADSSAGEGSSRSIERQSPPPLDERPPSQVPGYMIVGSGPASGNATSLMSTLHQDSGYGGSIIDGSSDMGSESWQAGLMEDRPTPSHTPVGPGYMSNAGIFLPSFYLFSSISVANWFVFSAT